MSQKYLIRIAELERLLSEQGEALRQKDQKLSQVEETEAFLRSVLTHAEEKPKKMHGSRTSVAR
ncbi:IS66 family transposase [Klebsiella pneumoniae]|uniref:IS66 family transposase n=1 Tax=Klebsiella pneumoniae TaxID=573 RepID=A0A2X3C214_KLEPN|nr:IS66 family transposase [Klebsiella pneumoniae]